ncbi:MAG: CopD family protein [Phycisphaeraceae bacterium]|nr:CopD family protein [Phycisphaerae bacterium]MBX3391691.1 CopD family protein [Phycisphaeraceae bacterium]HRJ48960.1 CopD family protein [Phycisphaerales bacterium]
MPRSHAAVIDKVLLIAHVLGASVWIGGHVVLLAVVIPQARGQGDVTPVRNFERSFGRIGLAALAVQVVTGPILASRWIGGWPSIFTTPTHPAHLVLAKVALLIAIVVLATHATHRLLPKLSMATLGRFTRHAWLVTLLSVALAIAGVSIRTGWLL